MDNHSEDSRLLQYSPGEDSDEDIVTDYVAMSGVGADPHQLQQQQQLQLQGGHHLPLVPTISVTPHSPGAKHYPVLEDNLQQLHEIHESIQQMRDHTVQAFNNQILGLSQYSRLSASCPSLNNDPGSDPDLLGSLNSSPMPNAPSGSFGDNIHGKENSKEWLICHVGMDSGDVTRRRSWTALEDLSSGCDKRASSRQRSMSLSSLDSEQDDPFLEQGDSAGSTGLLAGPVGGRRSTRGQGGASTHSLNEADLQNDFNKIVAKREVENLRLLPARLPLQKSVSTPSIIAARDIANEVAVEDDGHPVVAVSYQRPSGTESETEEELLAAIKHLVPSNIPISFDAFLADDTTYDHHSGKRRKRGSIFFRKKKDKSKKVPHQWVSACYGSAHACDWCSKPLTNKPALYCENCTTTVHQNACKDHIMDCTKPKITKSVSSVSSAKQHNTKRSSSSLQSHVQSSNSNRTTGCYFSPWRRVATKLGVNQIISEEKEGDGGHHDGSNASEDVLFDFLFEGPVTASDLDTDPYLGLQDEEPDSWTPTVGKEVTKKLKEKEIKRQEHIYEFILTEKHHCLTLRVMQKVFVEGLERHFQLGKDLDRMFPRLTDLADIHLRFLQKLRQRQRECSVIDTLSDILLEQFSGPGADKLKSAYGEFCSRHRDAVDIYKQYLQDRRFAEFVRHCQSNPLLKKKGIPECILFVTQRLTKYPLLIEPLIKTAKDNKQEQEKLARALALVKEILVEVDAQVAEKDKEDRKLEIYNRIEAKSFTVHRGNKFKKSDILSKNRRLRFEGLAMLMQGRGKMQLVMVIVLSDVLFFLLENNHKYSFFTPDNKAGVVSLQKLLVREKAGQDSRGIYLISSNPAEPEMFELKVHKPKDKRHWIESIREAVQSCQEDEDEGVVLSSEERQKLLTAKQLQIRQIVGVLRQKDLEQAQILEEKMALQQKLLAAAGMENILNPPNYCNLVTEDADSNSIWQEVLSAVQEVNHLASSLYATGTNLSRSVSSAGEHQSETYISPTLPKRAETFGGFDNANKDQLPPAVLKGVLKKNHLKENHDHSNCSTPVDTPDSEGHHEQHSQRVPNDQLPWATAMLATIPAGVLADNSADLPALLMLGQEQQLAAVQLSHYVYKLLSIISQQMTSISSLQAQLSACRSQLCHEDGKERRPVYRHNQQLEELRNLQDRLSQEKESWQREKDLEEKYIEEKKLELQRLQEQVRAEQNDVVQQREQLYRKLEVLTSQGILISPSMPAVSSCTAGEDAASPSDDQTSSGESSVPSPPAPESRRKPDPKWRSMSSKPSLPLNLLSATNQQKVAQNVKVRQQLPLKLANKLGGSGGTLQQILPLKLSQSAASEQRRSSSGSSGYQRLGSASFSPPGPGSCATVPPSHARTGSSPAMMQNVSPPHVPYNLLASAPGGVGNKAGRTHTYPKLPEKFRVQSPGGASSPQPSEEEVIFF